MTETKTSPGGNGDGPGPSLWKPGEPFDFDEHAADLERQIDPLRERRRALLEELTVIDDQLERVDAAVRALRGQAPKAAKPRPRGAGPSGGAARPGPTPGAKIFKSPHEGVGGVSKQSLQAVVRAFEGWEADEMTTPVLAGQAGVTTTTATNVMRFLEADGLAVVRKPTREEVSMGAQAATKIWRITGDTSKWTSEEA